MEGGQAMVRSRVPLLLLVVCSVLAAGPARSQVAKQSNDVLSAISFTSDKLVLSEPIEDFDSVQSLLPDTTRNGWEAFRLGTSPNFKAAVDKRTGRISLAEGAFGMFPGRGNGLTNANIAGFLGGRTAPDLAVVDALTRNFLPRVASLLGVDAATLSLDQGRSGQPASHVWFADYNVVREGMPIEGARVVFRYNNGNLVQWGSENLPSPGAAVPPTKLTRDAALAALQSYIGGLQAGDTLIDAGSLHLLPANVAAAGSADGFQFGNGRGIAKVWQFKFHRDGVMGTWQARVDTATGELLELKDVNDYAQATGGVYLISPTVGAETVQAMPFANLSTGGFTNSAGVFGASGAS